MLKKVLKYDMIALGKKILPILGLSLGLSIFTKIMLLLGERFAIFQMAAGIGSVFAIILIVAAFFYTFIMCIRRFYFHLLKEEGYLTNVLPVSKSVLVNSQIIATTIYSFLTIIVMIGSFFIMYYNVELIESIRVFLESFKTSLFPMALTLIFGYLNYYYLCTAAIGLGQMREGKKMNNIIMMGVVLYFASQILSLILMGGLFIIRPNILNELELYNAGAMNLIMWFAVVQTLIINAILHYISIKSIETKLDLE